MRSSKSVTRNWIATASCKRKCTVDVLHCCSIIPRDNPGAWSGVETCFRVAIGAAERREADSHERWKMSHVSDFGQSTGLNSATPSDFRSPSIKSGASIGVLVRTRGSGRWAITLTLVWTFDVVREMNLSIGGKDLSWASSLNLELTRRECARPETPSGGTIDVHGVQDECVSRPPFSCVRF